MFDLRNVLRSFFLAFLLGELCSRRQCYVLAHGLIAKTGNSARFALLLGIFRFIVFVLLVVVFLIRLPADAHRLAHMFVGRIVAFVHGVVRHMIWAVMTRHMMLAALFVMHVHDMVRRAVLGNVIFDGMLGGGRVFFARSIVCMQIGGMGVVVGYFVHESAIGPGCTVMRRGFDGFAIVHVFNVMRWPVLANEFFHLHIADGSSALSFFCWFLGWFCARVATFVGGSYIIV
jgi:hypothetical protein